MAVEQGHKLRGGQPRLAGMYQAFLVVYAVVCKCHMHVGVPKMQRQGGRGYRQTHLATSRPIVRSRAESG